MINARAKGAKGEREFCKWLEEKLQLTVKLERNLEQVRSGGADILGLPPFVFEIKRVEKLQLRKWWLQVKRATKNGDIPIVAYRQNRQPWRFLLPAAYLGIQAGFIQLEELEFTKWIRMYYTQ